MLTDCKHQSELPNQAVNCTGLHRSWGNGFLGVCYRQPPWRAGYKALPWLWVRLCSYGFKMRMLIIEEHDYQYLPFEVATAAIRVSSFSEMLLL